MSYGLDPDDMDRITREQMTPRAAAMRALMVALIAVVVAVVVFAAISGGQGAHGH